jgi:hypothetical protein
MNVLNDILCFELLQFLTDNLNIRHITTSIYKFPLILFLGKTTLNWCSVASNNRPEHLYFSNVVIIILSNVSCRSNRNIHQSFQRILIYSYMKYLIIQEERLQVANQIKAKHCILPLRK